MKERKGKETKKDKGRKQIKQKERKGYKQKERKIYIMFWAYKLMMNSITRTELDFVNKNLIKLLAFIKTKKNKNKRTKIKGQIEDKSTKDGKEKK